MKISLNPFTSSKLHLLTFIYITLITFSFRAFASPKEPIQIGVAASLTGLSAPYGTNELHGATLAIEEINANGGIKGQPLKLIVQDTEGTNRQTVTVVKRLIDRDKVKFIIGPTWVDSYQGAIPLINQAKVIAITPSGSAAVYEKAVKNPSYLFSTWYDLEQQIEILISHIKEEKKEAISLLFDQDPYFVTLRELVLARAKQEGIKILSDVVAPLGSTDFLTMLTRLKKEGVKDLYFGLADEGSVLRFLKERRQIYPELRLYGDDYIDGFIANKEILSLLDGCDFVSPQPRDKSFAVKFEKRFGEAPLLSASHSYDAVMILAEALKVVGTNTSDIRNYFLSNTFQTVALGETKFAPNSLGLQGGDIALKRVDKGNVSVIKEVEG